MKKLLKSQRPYSNSCGYDNVMSSPNFDVPHCSVGVQKWRKCAMLAKKMWNYWKTLCIHLMRKRKRRLL